VGSYELRVRPAGEALAKLNVGGAGKALADAPALVEPLRPAPADHLDRATPPAS
jgi:hypothetical protein